MTSVVIWHYRENLIKLTWVCVGCAIEGGGGGGGGAPLI